MNSSQSYLESLLKALSPLALIGELDVHMASQLGPANAGQTGFLRDADCLSALIGSGWAHQTSETDLPTMRRNYLATFVLRHSATWVGVAWEWVARRQPWIRLNQHEKSPYSPFQSELKSVYLRRKADAFRSGFESNILFPHLNLSARGIEWRLVTRTMCSYFDPYLPIQCSETSTTPGGYCVRHANPDLFATESPSEEIEKGPLLGQSRLALRHTASRRDTMMGFYASFNNLNAFTNQELETLVESFWNRLGQAATWQTNSPQDIDHAVLLLGYNSLHHAEQDDALARKARFRQLAKKLHPDCGGQSDDFMDLQKAYRTLDDHLKHA